MASKPRTAERLLTQKELAELLGLTSRQIRNLTEEGILKTEPLGAREFYPWPASNHRYIAYKVERSRPAASSKEEHLRARKLAAETEIAELKAAEARRELIPFDLHVARVAQLLDRLRGRLLAVPGYWAPEVVGLKDVKQAVGRLRPLMAELLDSLSRISEDWDGDSQPDD